MSDSYLFAKVVVPVAVTAANLIASNVPLTDYAAYVPGTTYAQYARVVSGIDVYESLQAANTGNTPASSPTWWKWVSRANRHRMFDDFNSTPTTIATQLSVQIRPAQVVNTLAVLNATGGTVRIRVIDPVAGTVYDKTSRLRARLARASWYAFFYSKRIRANDFIALDLPSFPNADIYVDITVTSGTVGVGNLVLGQAIDLADGIKLGARVGVRDYSGIEVNTFGVPTFVKRDYAKTASWQMPVPNDLVDTVMAVFASRRAKPSLWIGYAPIKATCIWGWPERWETLIPYQTESVLSADFQGNI